jgi:integrase
MGALTDVKLRSLKPRTTAYQVADGDGLVVEVRSSGQKAWLYRYRLFGRAEKLSLGSYPAVSLAEARDKHFEARRLVAAGKSPAHSKQAEKRRLADDLQTMRGLAKAYIADHVERLASGTRARHYIEKEILPTVGSKFLHEVTPGDCIVITERIRQRGAPSVARKVLEQLRGLFGYAVDRHLLSINPASQIRASRIVGTKPSRSRALTGLEIRQFLTAAESFPTSQGNRIAFRLILLTLCRKGELVKARWEEVDLDRGEWRVPTDNAKNRQEHVVFLSRQARALFTDLKGLAGKSAWVLPGRDPAHHITLTTLNQVTFVLKRRDPDLAWLGDVWIHDLRRTASTHLHEMGWVSDVIEKALNHTVGGVRGVYNRAQYAEQRREMLQAWADAVDAYCAGMSNVITGKFSVAA